MSFSYLMYSFCLFDYNFLTIHDVQTLCGLGNLLTCEVVVNAILLVSALNGVNGCYVSIKEELGSKSGTCQLEICLACTDSSVVRACNLLKTCST